MRRTSRASRCSSCRTGRTSSAWSAISCRRRRRCSAARSARSTTCSRHRSRHGGHRARYRRPAGAAAAAYRPGRIALRRLRRDAAGHARGARVGLIEPEAVLEPTRRTVRRVSRRARTPRAVGRRRRAAGRPSAWAAISPRGTAGRCSPTGSRISPAQSGAAGGARRARRRHGLARLRAWAARLRSLDDAAPRPIARGAATELSCPGRARRAQAAGSRARRARALLRRRRSRAAAARRRRALSRGARARRGMMELLGEEVLGLVRGDGDPGDLRSSHPRWSAGAARSRRPSRGSGSRTRPRA